MDFRIANYFMLFTVFVWGEKIKNMLAKLEKCNLHAIHNSKLDVNYS